VFRPLYGLTPGADSWERHPDDLKWLRRAMKNTFARLDDEDKEIIRAEYERFIELDRICNLKETAGQKYMAKCYILDRFGRRVEYDGEYKMILVGLGEKIEKRPRVR
jgi:hypothetical protein